MHNTIYIAADHGGFTLKQEIIKFISKEFPYIEIMDLGTDSDESVDFPEFGKDLSLKMKGRNNSLGIAICGSGVGISIACNRHKWIRCALCTNEYLARTSREHNNANVLALGARNTTLEDAKKITKVFLTTNFLAEEKYINRIKMISND